MQLHLERKRLAKVSTLAFIGSVAAAISPLVGTITARIIKRVGYRATAFTGSILLGLGEFTAGWSTNSVDAMFVTQGFLFGIGAALLFLVISPARNLYVRLNTDFIASRPPLFRPFGSRRSEDWRLVLSMAVLVWVLP